MPRLTAEAKVDGPDQLPLFEGGTGVDMAKLRARRAGLVEVTRAANTRIGYACDWRLFCAWCSMAGRDSLPASSDTVSLFVTHELERGLRVATVARKVAAVASYHRQAGHEAPVGGDVRAVVSGARRERRERPAGKAALTVDQLLDIESRMRGGDALSVRDRAILFFGFASALRRSELSALDLADVSITRDGLVVRLRRSKVDQEGQGREFGVSPAAVEPAICPVVAMRAWLRARGHARGPLFVHVSRGGRPIPERRLGGQAVAEVVQRAVTAVGLDPSAYGAHSLRAGCVTAAGLSGASAVQIMERTGHRSTAMIARYYRPDLFASNPLAKAI